MDNDLSRKLLQICTFILALVPTVTGVLNMIGINDPIFKELNLLRSPLLDSDLRFLGGIGRLISMILVGMPPVPFIAFTGFEIFGAPVFLYGYPQVIKEI